LNIKEVLIMNIILIVIDTLRADHLHCYGYPRETSPNIDNLAREGVLFENHITPAAHTTPAFTSIFTGQDPFHHGIVGTLAGIQNAREMVLNDLTPTLSDILYQNDYITVAFDNLFSMRAKPKWHSRGFKYYINLTPAGNRPCQLIADELNEELMLYVKNMLKKEGKYFLFLHYWDPHKPYNQPDKYRNIFPRNLEDLIVVSTKNGQYIKGVGLVRNLDEEMRENICLYDEEIMYVDKKVGEFLQVMKSIGMYNNSLIILTSDHGEGLAEHKCYDHRLPYEGTIKVPLIIKPPINMDIGRAGGRIKALTSHTDIMPTVLQMTKINYNLSPYGQTLDMDGESLIPLITNKKQIIHSYIISTGCYFLDDNVYKSVEVSIRTDNRKLILRSKVPPGNYDSSQIAGLVPAKDKIDYRLFNSFPKLELIDLTNDVAELNNIKNQEPEKVRELLDYLEPVIKSPYFYKEE